MNPVRAVTSATHSTPEAAGSGHRAVEAVLRQAVTRLGLSARAYHRVLKIARTIADLAGAAELTTAHVGEAIQYRSLDRKAEFA